VDDTETLEILTRLGLALAIGLLIGVERGWRERDQAQGERTAGLRTFALIGLFGGLWGLLSKELGAQALGLVFFAFAAAATLFRWRETEHEGTFGMTTLVAAFLTFSLGVHAAVGGMAIAAAAGVATAALLAAKEWLHAWLRVVTFAELRATLTLLAMSFIALPILPDRGYGPYQALNPHSLWLMTIAIAGVSFIGYVAVKAGGARYGTLLAGMAGGLVSSTAATLDLGRKARAAPERWRLLLAGALAASAVMFVRVGVIVALFGPGLLDRVAGPLAAGVAVVIAVALGLDPPWGKGRDGAADEGAVFANPFELRAVLGFAALLALVLVLTRALTETFGGEGSIALAAITGLADVDAITLSMTELAGSAAAAGQAATAVLVAVAANTLAKSGMAIAIGGRTFGLAYLAASLAALAAGGFVALAAGLA
jgi:uncharacterized membrane protein (DUF4010 family)